MTDLAKTIEDELRNELGTAIPDHVNRYAAADPELFRWYRDFREHILAEGAISPKQKILMVLAVLTADKQGGALSMYATIARDLGATKEEIKEAARIGVLFSGGPGIAAAAEISHFME